MTRRLKPTESLEEMLGRLELYNGSWAIKVRNTLIVFPQETTREQVEQVLKEAYELATNPSSAAN